MKCQKYLQRDLSKQQSDCAKNNYTNMMHYFLSLILRRPLPASHSLCVLVASGSSVGIYNILCPLYCPLLKKYMCIRNTGPSQSAYAMIVTYFFLFHPSGFPYVQNKVDVSREALCLSSSLVFFLSLVFFFFY